MWLEEGLGKKRGILLLANNQFIYHYLHSSNHRSWNIHKSVSIDRSLGRIMHMKKGATVLLNHSQEFRARPFFVTFDPLLSNGSDVIAENVRSMVPGELDGCFPTLVHPPDLGYFQPCVARAIMSY
ncbi:hypothetical protein EAG_08713 [Camponotus floridanus]|uniref:Uncharacterized protein n=1 Tax=Camponotus floridanus TaxID=104421 RepID=E2A823_CAMFO|nr:hypothetical protein EAG_08713 [Camponotus floridanus]